MVHQLSLVSSIPHNKYLQTISTLQALTGLSQPESISTYTLLAKPSYAFKPKFEPGKVNQIEQYYMRCVTTWAGKNLANDSEIIDILDPVISGESNIVVKKLFAGDDDDIERVWTLQISDIPVAGKNQGCCQQQIYESTLVHTHTNVEVDPVVEPSQNSSADVVDAMDVDIIELKTEKVVNGDNKDVQPVSGESKPELTVDKKSDEVTKETKEAQLSGQEDNKDEPKVKIEDDKPVDDSLNDNKEVSKDVISGDDSDIMEIDPPLKQQESPKQTQEDVKLEKPNPPPTESKITPGIRKDSFLVFLSDIGYEVINQYWLKGIRFFHGDIIIEIYKIFLRDDNDINGTTTDGIKLKLLDDSNQFQIKAYININKSTEIDLINLGVKDLIKLQEFLKNLFVLEIPDRMYMDSRIKQ